MAIRAGGPLDFTDGDTFKRITVTDAACTPRSAILVGICRTDVLDHDDAGWVYTPNVVRRRNGEFVVNVAATALGEPAINNEGPNEIVDLVYDLS